MKIVTFKELVRYGFAKTASGGAGTLLAGRDYVMSDNLFNVLLTEENRPKLYKVSDLRSRTRPFHIKAAKPGSTVLFHNASGGYGDQLLTWPIIKALADNGVKPVVLVELGNETCWSNMPWIYDVVTIPMTFAAWDRFDHHIFFDGVVNFDEHQTQGHPVDIMLQGCGFSPDDAVQKVVPPSFTEEEMRNAMSWNPDKRLAFYQLSASLNTRSLSPDSSVNILRGLATEFPQLHWVALYDEHNNKAYPEAVTTHLSNYSNVTLHQHPSLRELMAMVQRAAVTVGPDSFMVHACGVQSAPCVGLWCTIDPKNRVKYYENHEAVFETGACKHSPCYFSFGGFPNYCPSKENRQECSLMSAITVERVVQAVKKVTAGRL